MSVRLQSSVSARNGVFATTVDDELVLFDPEQGSYFGSGIVGERIWSFLSEERTVSDVCDALMDEFDVERSVCEAEVISFLNALAERTLVKVS